MTGSVFSGDAVKFVKGKENVRHFKITETRPLERLTRRLVIILGYGSINWVKSSGD